MVNCNPNCNLARDPWAQLVAVFKIASGIGHAEGTLSASMSVSGGKPLGMSTRGVAAASYY